MNWRRSLLRLFSFDRSLVIWQERQERPSPQGSRRYTGEPCFALVLRLVLERRCSLATRKKKPLWTCPKCRHKFVTRNMWHSCGRFRVTDHFKGKDPITRKLFRAFKTLVRTFGP